MRNPFIRMEIKSALESSARLLGKESFFKDAISGMEQMEGERITYNSPMPALYIIKDGILVIRQSKVDSFSILRTSRQLEHDEDLFKFSSVRNYRFPFVNNKGMMLKKGHETHHSIYYLTFRKEIPKRIEAFGRSKVFLLGECFSGDSFEIWLHDDAELVMENLTKAQLVTVHVRDRAKITIKSGFSESLYVSSRVHTHTDLGGFLSDSIVLNATNGPVGSVILNPQKNYFMLGRKLQGSLECKSDLKPVKLNSKKFKMERFFVKSLPKKAVKTVRGVVLAGGYMAVCSLLVLSIVHGVYPAIATVALAKNALIGAAAFFGVGMTIRRVVKNARPESFVRSSI